MTDSRLEIVKGDITRQVVDAIVNAANNSLLGGGGVDGAIHRAAGLGLLAECKALGGCPTGQARITGGHALKVRHVIHAVGPIWEGGKAGEADLLAACYKAVMHLAVDHECRSIAFPAISCGAYGYPWEEAARVSLGTVHAFLQENTSIELVRWVLFGDDIFDAWHMCHKELSDARARS